MSVLAIAAIIVGFVSTQLRDVRAAQRRIEQQQTDINRQQTELHRAQADLATLARAGCRFWVALSELDPADAKTLFGRTLALSGADAATILNCPGARR
ncbi:hypothetical protein [Parafrankia discariae]|uniref:hypothetical protein n=1 Tax=Parafrankia discariae TaxID=365528 RepID=UPI0003672265|nr:hypothetical protein [Parafrankia discariae]